MTTLPLRIGIVGCGNIGAGSHLPTWLAHPELARVVALADPTQAALDAARTTAGLRSDQVHRDPADLIARDDVDVVDVCTPQHLRRTILVDAAKAGKHILCEKPLATVPADAASAVSAAEAAGITLAMVHNYLWLPEIQAARRVINSGEIGTVRAVIVNYLGIVDVPGAAAYRANWRHDVGCAGGGVLMDILHGVYVAEALLGEQVQRVSAYVDSRDPAATVEDLALCRFETVTNAALVNIAWGHGPGGMEIVGTDGRIAIRYRDGGTAPWAPLEHVQVSTGPGQHRVELPADTTITPPGQVPHQIIAAFEHVLLDFVDAVRAGRSPAASGVDGHRILEATLGAYKSAVTGETVNIPLDPVDPVYLHGAPGVRKLALPAWSPIHRCALYSAATG